MYSFTIKVEALNDGNKAYAIIFDSRESVENIQKYYKKYDEMIADLDYDEVEDIVKFNNTDKSDLNCVSVLYIICEYRNVSNCLQGRKRKKKRIRKIITMVTWNIMNQKKLRIKKRRKRSLNQIRKRNLS